MGSVDYAITITLRPKLFQLDCVEQLKSGRQEIIKFLDKNPDIRCSLAYEFTKSFNIHFHGTIKTVDMSYYTSFPKFIHDHFRKSKVIGFICIKQIDNIESWTDYIIKDYENTRQIMNEFPTIRDDYNLLPDYLSQFLIETKN